MPRTRSWLYGSTIFLSSFLLFLIQPVFAKLILPWFGGSAAVWTTCLVFFQGALVAGYGYSYFVARRLRPMRQALLHGVLLAAAIAMLPAAILAFPWNPGWGFGWSPVPRFTLHPAAQILSILTVSIGLPYILLSATAPLLQAWYARSTGSRDAEVESPESQPYRLYALSNAGALLALIAYPAWIEPRWTTHFQERLWSTGFVTFAALCAVTGVIAARSRGISPETSGAAEHDSEPLNNAAHDAPVSAAQRLEWIALAAGGSMLLLAITNQLTENVAPVPLLWILPLAIYLLTFILCFGSSRWAGAGAGRDVLFRFLAVALAGVAYSIYDIQLSDAIVVLIPILCIGLFFGCMFCHSELNRRKPAPAQLTSFYLMIAAGGALGAVFVGLVAPAIFAGVYELPVALLVIALLALWTNLREKSAWSARLLWAAVTVAMLAVWVAQVRGYHHGAVELVRSFYGSLRVVDSDGVRTLYHGTVEHGSQFLSPDQRRTPTTYYGYSSGVGLALQFLDRQRRARAGALRVGVIGLGTGTLAAYGRAGDQLHFYEINPQVIGIAQGAFSYLRDSTARIEITSGDARLSLEAEDPQEFDMLIVDAFSGDAIPVHLLTREAFALYFRHLKPEGALALHVSNQYVDLSPVAGALAAAFGRPAVEIQTTKDAPRQILAADWILITANRDFLASPEIQRAGERVPARPGMQVWTDDYNNLLQVMRWLPTS
jgi:hypothetical protein